MQIKDFKDKDNYIPDLAYLAYFYYRFSSLDDSEIKNLANDRIKRFQAIINERLKQGQDINDVSPLFQLNIYLGSTVENTTPFLPNLSSLINYDVFEPRLKITKALIDHKFLTFDSGMLFENKFILGFENRIFDGIPIVWKGNLNSLVTLIHILFILGKIETEDNFDTMIHRKRPKREKNHSQKHWRLEFPNVPTLIAGKYMKNDKEKTPKGNFFINNSDSNKKWHTIYRRCEGIRKQLWSFFEKVRGSPKGEILDYLIKNKDNFNFLEPSKMEGEIDLQIIELVCECYKKPNISNSYKPLLLLKKNK